MNRVYQNSGRLETGQNELFYVLDLPAKFSSTNRDELVDSLVPASTYTDSPLSFKSTIGLKPLESGQTVKYSYLKGDRTFEPVFYDSFQIWTNLI